jgi:hypothetical protein
VSGQSCGQPPKNVWVLTSSFISPPPRRLIDFFRVIARNLLMMTKMSVQERSKRAHIVKTNGNPALDS